MSGLRKVVAHSASASTAMVLSAVYLYTRLQAVMTHTTARFAKPGADRDTFATPPGRSLGTLLASTPLARREMTFSMRDGSHVACRILDSACLLSVHVDGDYQLPGIDWSRVRTVLDIGAHVGSFSISVAMSAPNSRILAVEPNPDTFGLLVANIRRNGLEERVRALNVAVGPVSGSGRLELREHSLGTRISRTGHGDTEVPMMTLEELLAEAGIDDVDFVKLDSEGMEYDVLGNTPREVLRRIGVFACEYHPEPGHQVASLDAVLSSAGFRVQRPDTPVGVIWATR